MDSLISMVILVLVFLVVLCMTKSSDSYVGISRESGAEYLPEISFPNCKDLDLDLTDRVSLINPFDNVYSVGLNDGTEASCVGPTVYPTCSNLERKYGFKPRRRVKVIHDVVLSDGSYARCDPEITKAWDDGFP